MQVLDAGTGPRLIRGSAVRIGSYVLGILCSVASSALLLRHLGVIDTGRFVTVIALGTIVAGISDLGLSSLALREYAIRDSDERNRFMGNMLGMRCAYVVAGITVAVAFGAMAGYPHTMLVGIPLIGVGVMLGALQQSFSVPLSATLRLGWVATLTLLISVGSLLAYVVLVAMGAGLMPFYGVLATATLPALVVTIWLVRRQTPLTPRFDATEWRRTMRQILPYSAAAVFYVLYFRFTVVSLSLLSTPRETGYYGAAFRVLDAVTVIPPLLASSAFPILARAARDDRERLCNAMERLFHGMLIIGVWIGLSLHLGAALAIAVVAGSAFEPSIDILRVLAVAVVGTCLISSWGYGLLALGYLKQILVANLIAACVAALSSVLLIPDYGAIGAAFVLTVAEFVVATGYGVALWRIDRRLVVGLRLLPRVLIAGAVAIGLPVILSLPSVPALAAATVLYFGTLAMLRAIPPEIREALFRSRH
jgi:O-antigen/teichoic acid export membrane protein